MGVRVCWAGPDNTVLFPLGIDKYTLDIKDAMEGSQVCADWVLQKNKWHKWGVDSTSVRTKLFAEVAYPFNLRRLTYIRTAHPPQAVVDWVILLMEKNILVFPRGSRIALGINVYYESGVHVPLLPHVDVDAFDAGWIYTIRFVGDGSLHFGVRGLGMVSDPNLEVQQYAGEILHMYGMAATVLEHAPFRPKGAKGNCFMTFLARKLKDNFTIPRPDNHRSIKLPNECTLY